MVRAKPRPCRTCKIRKVKCDEVWPACNRCVVAGRVCDGYGIWGGGGNTYQDRTSGAKVLARRAPQQFEITIPVTIASNITSEEQGYLEWFLQRSVVKLPGIFFSGFWETLVVQASSNEPAVLHALLALGATHKREVLHLDRPRRSYHNLDEHEEFMLRQYSKAIRGLQPHFLARNKESLRIALITCLMFVSLEFLRGHIKTGNIHLQNGLKLVDTFSSVLWASYDSIDQCILETFVRLQLQVQMFGQKNEHIFSIPQGLVFGLPSEFQTLSQARQHLDFLIEEIMHLSQLHRQTVVSEEDPPSSELVRAQSNIRAELGTWHKTLVASLDRLRVHSSTKTILSHKFLILYSATAAIMIETCFEIARELIFEKFTDSFLFLLAQAVDVQNILLSTARADLFLHHDPVGSNTIFDLGWIPPLYYIALKCRVHRIRTHAIKLLNSNRHKEGIWDSRLAACTAQEVMKIEERDFYQGFPINDDFSIVEAPNTEDLLLPVLPESYRVKAVEVVLPDDPSGKAMLVCKKQGEDGKWKTISRELDVYLDGQAND